MQLAQEQEVLERLKRLYPEHQRTVERYGMIYDQYKVPQQASYLCSLPHPACVAQPEAWYWEQVLQTPSTSFCLKCLFPCLQVEMLRKFMLTSLIIFGANYFST